MKLSGKVAVITGAARGVGAAIAAMFANEGASVVAVDSLGEPLDALVAVLRSQGLAATAVIADVSSQEGNSLAIQHAVREYGGLDCLVANAAVQRFGKLADTAPAIWDEVQNVNLKGVYLGCQ